MKILRVKPRSNLVDLCLDDKETFREDLGQLSSYLVEKDEIKWRKIKSYKAKPTLGLGPHLHVPACVVSLKSEYISILKSYGQMV